ncbi:biopolymer transporter ExbD, partial [Burkholderia sp. Ax-1720]|nr:biopolymer transporter ExbD [Burkholderia sp. Ax-1720]
PPGEAPSPGPRPRRLPRPTGVAAPSRARWPEGPERAV